MKLSFVRPVFAALVLLIPFVALYRWQMNTTPTPSQGSSGAIIGSLNGQAEVLPWDITTWHTVSQASVRVGDTIHAVDNVRLAFAEGTVLALDPGAQIVVEDAALESGKLVISHQAGRLNVETDNPSFQLNAPSLAVTVDKSSFSVEVTASGDSYVSPQRGLIYGKTDGEVVAVAAGESLRTGVGQRAKLQAQATPIVLPAPPPAPPRTPTPTVTPPPPTQPPQRVHIIAKGDSLFALAMEFGISVEDIAKANGIQDPNMLSIGQKIIIPDPK